jgi:hypothetical protein
MASTGIQIGVNGLNETSSVHGLAEGQATVLLNVSPDKGGRLRKRRGTRVLTQLPPTNNGGLSQCVPFTTNSGNGFLVEKTNSDLWIYSVSKNRATPAFVKAGLFQNDADTPNDMLVGVTLPGLDPRLLLLTGTSMPVQLTFTERTKVTKVQPNTLDFEGASEFADTNAQNTQLLCNGVVVPGAAITYTPNAGGATVSVTNLGSLQLPPAIYGEGGISLSDYRFDLLMCTAQYWVEGLQWYGSDIYQSVTRFNAGSADLNTPIPKELLTDLRPNENDTISQYPIGNFGFPIRATSSPDLTVNTYQRDASKQPVADGRYWFGNGAVYNPGAGFVETAPFSFTWGGLLPSGLPTRIYAHRYRELRMNRGRGVLPSMLRVQVNSVPFTQNGTGSPSTLPYVPAVDTYQLRNRDGTVIPTGSALADLISFTGTLPSGLSYNQRVEVLRVPEFPLVPGNEFGLGFNCIDARSYDFAPKDFGYYPVFGLHDFIDTKNRAFPTCGCLYQNRLVLSGFRGNPTAVIASAVRDTRTPGNGEYNHFMLSDAFVEPTDALVFNVGTDTSDAVVALTTWNDSLVAFTRNGVYTAIGKGDNSFNAGNLELQRVSRKGILNRKSFVATNSMLLFVSEDGVESVGVGGEETALSEPVKSRFASLNSSRYRSLVKVAYLDKTNAVYFFMPESPCTNHAYYLLVLNLDTGGWSEYESTFGFPVFDACTVDSVNGGQQLIGALTTKWADNPFISPPIRDNRMLLKFEDESRSIDYVVGWSYGVNNQLQPGYSPPVERRYVEHFWGGSNNIFPTSFWKTGQIRGFTTLPYTNVQDVSVYYDQVPIQFQPGGEPEPGFFSKLPNGDVVINFLPTTSYGNLVRILHRQPAVIYLD